MEKRLEWLHSPVLIILQDVPRASGSAYICMINRHMEDAIQTGVPRRTVASKIGYKFYFYLYNPVLVKQVREVCIGRQV